MCWNVCLHLDSRSIYGLIVIWACLDVNGPILHVQSQSFVWTEYRQASVSMTFFSAIMASFASSNKAGGKSFIQYVKRLWLIEICIALWMNDYLILNPGFTWNDVTISVSSPQLVCFMFIWDILMSINIISLMLILISLMIVLFIIEIRNGTMDVLILHCVNDLSVGLLSIPNISV